MPTKVELPPPPPVADRVSDEGGGSDWVHLITARHDIDAHLLEGRLHEAGIESRQVKDRNAPGAWLMGGSNPWAPVGILVHRIQLDDARLVLAEISLDGPNADELAALARSRRRSFPVVWWVTALLLGLVLTVLALNQLARSTTFCQIPALCDQSGTP
jgi:hypothetical protein